jgi:calcineurin-like phosphoesterase family protein
MTYLFSADSHYGHSRVIEYSSRPFSSVKEMDEVLIANWNSVVRNDDHIYFLGDLGFYKPSDMVAIVRRLNGIKYWVFGNHDKRLRKCKELTGLFQWCKDIAEIKIPDVDGHHGMQTIVLSHYPFLIWNKSHYGTWNAHGHSHGSLPDNPNSLSMDVGVDPNNYTPITYEQIKAHMKKKSWKPIDHHKPRE